MLDDAGNVYLIDLGMASYYHDAIEEKLFDDEEIVILQIANTSILDGYL